VTLTAQIFTKLIFRVIPGFRFELLYQISQKSGKCFSRDNPSKNGRKKVIRKGKFLFVLRKERQWR